ncbi:hypothetical protein HZ326_27562 [Fusarium oxysporum f. sp. albedinis]|nr:hypothetical protein HZ326_27562 [Fusarium oxysporum f. sp. albedinis]
MWTVFVCRRANDTCRQRAVLPHPYSSNRPCNPTYSWLILSLQRRFAGTASRRSRQINSFRRKILPYHVEGLRLTVSTVGIGKPQAPQSVLQNKLSYLQYIEKDCH